MYVGVKKKAFFLTHFLLKNKYYFIVQLLGSLMMKNTYRLFFLLLVMINFNHTTAKQVTDSEYSAPLNNQHYNKFYLSLFGGESLSNKKYSAEGVSKKFKHSNVYGIGIGYKWDQEIRTDITLSQFKGFKFNAYQTLQDPLLPSKFATFNYTQTIKSTLLAANIYYDFANQSCISPYINAGIGLARNSAGTFYSNASSTADIGYNPGIYNGLIPGKVKYSFAWSIGGGISFKASDVLTWDVINYRYFDLGKFGTKNTSLSAENNDQKGRLAAHSITTGIRVSFDIFK
jgi:opacity protein-like surface antigen